ncbi:LysM peptidoglycan-binding domain-containing protein [Paracoccus sp. (in: a-proteobacteria)]|uniref:LysM peptidoglycan-binding domain-containing protein n=1 Tax=Paracoccus sp. TaxID=267 RepID=UPI003A8BE7D2
MSRKIKILAAMAASAALLASCGANTGFDPDLRGWIPGTLSTAEAASRAAPRPAPDNRGVITFGNTQVALAQAGDTPATVATRLGLGADELARHNALPANSPLDPGSLLVLPRPVAAGAPMATAPGRTSSTGIVSDPFAAQGMARPDIPGRSPVAAATPPTAAPASSLQPRQHQVAAGETAWSIARKYGVGVQDLASWNGLPSNMTVRVGQRLIIPVPGQQAPNPTAVTTAPGSGSPTPRPPSASEPLPAEQTAAATDPGPKTNAPDMGASRTAASSGGRFSMPVPGAIVRVYEKGRNEGIDIAAPAGTAVKAAGSGTVAAITRDTKGTPIVVIRHDGGLMTVYTGMDKLDVAKGNSVTVGQAIGTAGGAGFIHFEVRRGFDSVDPEDYLK